MRSSELARAAGVSVRTLRHYHQVGVLAEPERSYNGYREYDVYDLVRVLRIRRLAALGIALERMPPLLDDAGADAAAALDEVDTELAAQISRLQAQRSALAELRRHRALPDIPPELAAYSAVFAAAGVSPEMARLDRDQALLLAQLAGEEGQMMLARLYERLVAPEVVADVASAMEAFSELGEDAPESDVHRTVSRFVSVIRPVLDATEADQPALDLSPAENLLTAYTDGVLTPIQRRALALLQTELERATQE